MQPMRPLLAAPLRPIAAAVLSIALLATVPLARAAAQGSLGTQGFGYPTGELSTRALGTGGALGEFDLVSPLNPAALSFFGRTALALQYDPEFRSIDYGGRKQNNTIARFPVIAVGVPLRRRVTLGLSASTFLDRTFSTEFPTTTRFPGGPVNTIERIESSGSIADLRAGVGVYVSRALRVGIAGHVLTGENRLVSARSFEDTLRFGNVSDTSSIDYRGSSVSAGFELTPIRGVSLAGSLRKGGTLRALRNDTTLSRAHAPDRYGVGLRLDRVTGATFAASYARETWSRMQPLGTSALQTHDSEEFAGGVEALGPRLGDNALLLRLGGRRRTLPFGIDGAEIRETAFSGGLGLPLVGGRTLADVAVQRANRTPHGGSAAVQGVREHAWTLSVGFTVRP